MTPTEHPAYMKSKFQEQLEAVKAKLLNPSGKSK
jgi:hypothetical protein